MNSKLIKVIALLAVICILRLNVVASSPIMGKLKTRDNKPVTVNGANVTSGITIMSGAQIQCPEKIGATVDLGSLGRLDIAPKTDLTLTFDSTKITVELRSGYVVLTTQPGINGTVNTLEGRVFATDPAKLSSVIARTSDAEGPETSAQIGAGSGGLGTAGVSGIAGAAAAIIGGAAAASSGRGRNLSSDNPRAPE
jgi:hypothetical protein